MKQHFPQAGRQTGAMLIEALVAILIFSVGIVAIVGMQGSAVKASSDAKYRSEAALLANALIGTMWTGNRTQATLQTAFSSPNGNAYQAWAWVGIDPASPGTQSAPGQGTVLQTLPGASASPPTVVITPDTSTSDPSSLVTITIFWKAPSETTMHNYVAVAQIGG